MQFSAAEIAQIINGKLEGNTNSTVASFGKIEEANEGQLSFLANPKYEDFLYTTKASVVIINNSLHLKQPVAATLIRVPDAYSAFALLLDKAQQMKTSQLSGIQDPVFMHPTAKIGENVYLGAFVFIGENAIVGNNVKIFPGCFIGNNVSIDVNSIIHAGVKIYHDTIIGKNVS
ncbi:MAG TPA: UDP-3-O-(3-hydroxymyristoyl)glucosamine N-acyltransferase, partial [Chitinophagaceae bacterium]|nr:UDP-3-O-(3-hydroxymyristoyl)glucosamine N-acyltransferase [Chitinophagaceae bacterium]